MLSWGVLVVILVADLVAVVVSVVVVVAVVVSVVVVVLVVEVVVVVVAVVGVGVGVVVDVYGGQMCGLLSLSLRLAQSAGALTARRISAAGDGHHRSRQQPLDDIGCCRHQHCSLDRCKPGRVEP